MLHTEDFEVNCHEITDIKLEEILLSASDWIVGHREEIGVENIIIEQNLDNYNWCIKIYYGEP